MLRKRMSEEIFVTRHSSFVIQSWLASKLIRLPLMIRGLGWAQERSLVHVHRQFRGHAGEVSGSSIMSPLPNDAGQDATIDFSATGCSIGQQTQDLQNTCGRPTYLRNWRQRNIYFREFCTVNRSTKRSDGKTRVGNAVEIFLAYSHIGHDCAVGDSVACSQITEPWPVMLAGFWRSRSHAGGLTAVSINFCEWRPVRHHWQLLKIVGRAAPFSSQTVTGGDSMGSIWMEWNARDFLRKRESAVRRRLVVYDRGRTPAGD